MLWHVLHPEDDCQRAAFICASKRLACRVGWLQVSGDGPGADHLGTAWQRLVATGQRCVMG